jgi:hypothetical protein
MLSAMTIALVTALLPNVAADEGINWHSDYQKARGACMTAKKPMAVVVGAGLGGWHKLAKEGKMGEETMKLLREHYVCLFIDSETPEGKKLAADFALSSGGIVLSDKTCDIQAFYHNGTLAEIDLVACLKKCADPNRTVRTTETLSTPRYSMYPGSNGSSPTSYYGAQNGYNAPQFSNYGYAPSYSSCPNCRR